MALKTLVVHLDNSDRSKERLDVAVNLALEHDAHLYGLYVIPEITIPGYASVEIPAEVFQRRERELLAESAAQQKAFLTTIEQADCIGEWRCEKGFADEVIAAQARYADLVIAGQATESHLGSAGVALENNILLGAARPVLFVPYIGPKSTLGRRVLIAWNGSQESVRAVHDALPVLRNASMVRVVSVNPPATAGDLATADICLHLARHDVIAEGDQVIAKNIDTGDVLLSYAADHDIDLIVMGGYGHSRIRETIFGGVTKHLLSSMTVPVLMSH